MVYRSGLMAPNMRAIGRMIKFMDMGPSIKQMVMFIKEGGKRIWFMASENIGTVKGLNMKEIGSLTCNMDLVKKYGLMAQSMRATITEVRSRAMGNTPGKMAPSLQVTGVTTRSVATVHISGRMVDNMMGNGRIT